MVSQKDAILEEDILLTDASKGYTFSITPAPEWAIEHLIVLGIRKPNENQVDRIFLMDREMNWTEVLKHTNVPKKVGEILSIVLTMVTTNYIEELNSCDDEAMASC